MLTRRVIESALEEVDIPKAQVISVQTLTQWVTCYIPPCPVC